MTAVAYPVPRWLRGRYQCWTKGDRSSILLLQNKRIKKIWIWHTKAHGKLKTDKKLPKIWILQDLNVADFPWSLPKARRNQTRRNTRKWRQSGSSERNLHLGLGGSFHGDHPTFCLEILQGKFPIQECMEMSSWFHFQGWDFDMLYVGNEQASKRHDTCLCP